MMTPVDYQPPFVPKISVDTKDATPQRRQTEEISANEIAGIGELCAMDPGDDNFYNLRNVDDTKKSRKKEQQRMREERIQNNRLRKQRKIREAREIVDRARKAAEVLDENMLKFEAWRKKQRKQRLSKQEDDNDYGYCSGDEREREGVYTSEIINEPPSGLGEWLPYESDNEFGTAFELKRTSWGVEKFTLELARCMVGLESFTGDKQLFSCSGTIVEFLNDVGYVVTSASLVRCTYKDAQADELKINVWLASGERLDGCVSNVDFYYNICVIKVSSTFHLPRKSFSPNTGFFDFYECHSKDVVALGRTCKPWSLKVALGKLIPRRSRFDCEELLVSSCKISKVDQVYHLEEISKTEEKIKHELPPLENHNEDSAHGSKELLESHDMSIECRPGIKDMEFESDFTIRTIPLQFEDESLHSGMQNNPAPTAHENTACNIFCTSQSATLCSSISSCKSIKARRRLSANSETLGLTETISDGHIQVEFLRFEVSQHTGRIHLYICVPGYDSRPRPLFENFLPEEVESPLCSSNVKKGSSQFLKRNPAFCNMFKAFVKEWLALRPIDQKKLLGKPLQLPLSLELCYLKNSINHSTKGLLKGGSRRRITPLNDVSNPLPENAEWRKVVLHNGTTKEREYIQGWKVDDEPLCKLCQGLCNGKLAKSPEYFEDLFCGLACFQEYRLRTSGRALRQALFQIERGICSQCKLDCFKLVKYIKPLHKEKREEYIRNVAPNIASRKKLLDKLVHEPTEGNAWHADHIIPVYKGGGECTLENMRTLCVACHYEVTRAQRKELKELRTKAKEHLKNAMNHQKDEASEATEVDDNSLLVTVPGSAYS